MVPFAPRRTTVSVVAVPLTAVTRICSESIVTVKLPAVTHAKLIGAATASDVAPEVTADVSDVAEKSVMNDFRFGKFVAPTTETLLLSG